MIKSLSVKNFKSLVDVRVEFTPLNAIVGQNNTGKTSILKAVSAISKVTQVGNIEEAFGSEWQTPNELISNGLPGLEMEFKGSFCHSNRIFEYSCAIHLPKKDGREAQINEEILNEKSFVTRDSNIVRRTSRVFDAIRAGMKNENYSLSDEFTRGCRFVEIIQLNPQFLRNPLHGTFTKTGKVEGSNFSDLLMSLLLDDRARFDALEKTFLEIFPGIKALHLKSNSGGGQVFTEFILSGNNRVPARSMSDGVLMVLGLLTLLYADKERKIFLIEELETHFHISILEKVIQLFRIFLEQNTDSQIIFTTHSPYLLNYLEPSEVNVVHMNDKFQTQVKRFSEYSQAEQLSVSFGTGDIWAMAGEVKIFEDR